MLWLYELRFMDCMEIYSLTVFVSGQNCVIEWLVGIFLRVAWDLGASLFTVLQGQLDTPEVPVQNPTLVFHFHCFLEAELTRWLLVVQRLILINHLQVSLLQMGS